MKTSHTDTIDTDSGSNLSRFMIASDLDSDEIHDIIEESRKDDDDEVEEESGKDENKEVDEIETVGVNANENEYRQKLLRVVLKRKCISRNKMIHQHNFKKKQNN